MITIIIFINHNHSVARYGHTAWTPPSLPDSIVLLGGCCGSAVSLTAEIVPGKKAKTGFYLFSTPGGETFSLQHNREYACGIQDGLSIVITGGFKHNYVTRWVAAKC